MDNVTIVDVEEPQDKIAEYRAAIRQCIARMDRIQEQMGKDQRDIERLQAETRAILTQLKAA